VLGIVFVLVLAAEADETRQTVTLLIASLIGIAVALALLTVWYWRYTDPRRRHRRGVPAGTSSVADDVVDDTEANRSGRVVVGDAVADTLVEAPADGAGRVAAPTTVEVAGLVPPVPGLVPGGPEDEMATGPVVDEAVPGPVLAGQTWDFVAAARRAEEEGITVRRPERPAQPRIQVSGRSGAPADGDDGDELAVARRRREREASRGLSDEAWQTVRRSVFNKLDP
jgi:hypothetical protein